MRVSARNIALVGAVGLALANLGRIPAGVLAGRSAPLTLADGVALFVWFALVVAILTGRARIVVDGIMSSAIAFVAIAAFSTALAVERYRLGLDGGVEVYAFLARWILYFGWYPFVAWVLTADEAKDANRFTNNALLAICAFGIVQALFIPEFGTRIADSGLTPAWEYQGRRLVSTLLDPNFAGAMALLALLPALALTAEKQRVHPLALIVPAAALILTASRSSILALAVGLAFIVLARGISVKLLKTIGVGVLLILPLLPLVIEYGSSMKKFSVDSSATQRLVTWTRAFTLFAEHPWLGIGFNASKQAQEARGWIFIGGADTGFDGGLLFVMVMTGVIGAALYVLLLGRGVFAARRVWKDATLDPDDRATATATAASVFAILVHSLFSNSLLLPFVMQVLWVRFGQLAHISAQRRNRLGLAIAIPIALAVTSCGPCGGTALCNTDYAIRLEGSIRSHETGAPVSGAKIDVSVKGADGTQRRRATTDASGLWSVKTIANCCDDFSVETIIAAPGQPAYVAPSFRARGSNTAGDAIVLEPWLDRPSARFAMYLVGKDKSPLSSAAVAFVPTDGVPTVDAGGGAGADENGIVHFMLRADRVGEVIGTLTVQHPSLAKPWTLRGMVVPLEYRYRLPRAITVEVSGDPALAPVIATRVP